MKNKDKMSRKAKQAKIKRLQCNNCGSLLDAEKDAYLITNTYFDKDMVTVCGICHPEAFAYSTFMSGKTQKIKDESIKENVKHPKHYTSHPSGIECIDIVKHFNFDIGSAIKYLWRAGLKGDALEDLQKAREFIDFEIERIIGS